MIFSTSSFRDVIAAQRASVAALPDSDDGDDWLEELLGIGVDSCVAVATSVAVGIEVEVGSGVGACVAVGTGVEVG